MSKKLLISESEKNEIKRLYGVTEQTMFDDLIKNTFGKMLGGGEPTSSSDSKEDLLALLFSKVLNKSKSDDDSDDIKTDDSGPLNKTPVDFKEVTKKVIERIEGGYYNPSWHYKPAMGKSGETMFGIDRKHGGTLNTGAAGTEFWNIIDKNKSRSVWTHGYRGGALAEKLTDLVVEIMRPHYENLAKKYLSPKSLEVVSSSKPLLFHFIYASWNGPGFFKKFAEDINKKVSQGVTSDEELQDVALDSRRHSAASGSVNKIEKIFNEFT